MVITCKTIRVLSGEHLLDIGRTLLDTETIGAFLSGHMQDTITIGVKLEHILNSLS